MTDPPIIRIGAGPPELWIVAGVHGDEVEGIAVVEDTLTTIQPDRGTLVGVPVAHPAALELGTRRGPDNLDLNRTYPGRLDGSPTEQAAYSLWSQLELHADALLTLHSWSRTGRTVNYVEYARGDGRGRDLAHALGLLFAEPFDWPDGLLPKVATEHGIQAVEMELGGLGRHEPQNTHAGLTAVRAAAGALGMLEPTQARVGSTTTVRRHTLQSRRSGRARQLLELGAPVHEGQPIAELRALDGTVTETLEAPAAGWVAIHVTYGQVEIGAAVAVVFEQAEPQ